MAQVTSLAATTSAGASSGQAIVAGDTIGIYTTSAGGLPADAHIKVTITTPDKAVLVLSLTPSRPVYAVEGRGTIIFTKPASAVAYGAYLNQA